MNSTQLALLYNTMVLPHLQYCIINWGNFKHDSNIGLWNKLLTLQKCLVRIVNGAHRISHADPLFFNKSILKIDDLYEQSLRIFAYKLHNSLLPQEVQSMFPKCYHNHNTRGAKNNFFVVRSDKRSMKSIAPACWNTLPLQLKQCPSVLSFKNTSRHSGANPMSKKIQHQNHHFPTFLLNNKSNGVRTIDAFSRVLVVLYRTFICSFVLLLLKSSSDSHTFLFQTLIYCNFGQKRRFFTISLRV